MEAPQLWDNAVLAIVVQLVHKVLLVPMDTTDLTASQANLVTVAPLPHHNPNSSAKSLNNAHAKLHQVMLVPQDQRAMTDHPEMQVPQALMASQEIKDHAAHPDPQATAEKMATRELLVTTANSSQAKQARRVLLAPLVNPVQEVLLVSPVQLVKMVVPAQRVHLVMLVPLAALAKLVVLVALVTQAKLVPLAAASTAHLLVWLLVIKKTSVTLSNKRKSEYV